MSQIDEQEHDELPSSTAPLTISLIEKNKKQIPPFIGMIMYVNNTIDQ